MANVTLSPTLALARLICFSTLTVADLPSLNLNVTWRVSVLMAVILTVSSKVPERATGRRATGSEIAGGLT